MFVEPVTLSGFGVRLEPLALAHEAGLAAAAADGELWTLRVAGVPEPGQTRAYVKTALAGRAAGERFAFVVRAENGGVLLGTTGYHGIEPAIRRLEIGYTWYRKSAQHTHVNTACKLLLLTHAFEQLGCAVVGWRTDCFNLASQRAIERLGAKKDGVIRHHKLRRDGTVRDTVMYSMMAGEWPESRAHLLNLLQRHAAPPSASGVTAC